MRRDGAWARCGERECGLPVTTGRMPARKRPDLTRRCGGLRVTPFFCGIKCAITPPWGVAADVILVYCGGTVGGCAPCVGEHKRKWMRMGRPDHRLDAIGNRHTPHGAACMHLTLCLPCSTDSCAVFARSQSKSSYAPGGCQAADGYGGAGHDNSAPTRLQNARAGMQASRQTQGPRETVGGGAGCGAQAMQLKSSQAREALGSFQLLLAGAPVRRRRPLGVSLFANDGWGGGECVVGCGVVGQHTAHVARHAPPSPPCPPPSSQRKPLPVRAAPQIEKANGLVGAKQAVCG